MNISQRISAGVKKQMASLKKMHAKRVAASDVKARRQLATAKTKTEKEKIRLQLARDKMAAKKELYEAQKATKDAKVALEKARKEAGDLTVGERIGAFGSSLGKGAKAFYNRRDKSTRVARRRKPVVKRVTAKKPVSKKAGTRRSRNTQSSNSDAKVRRKYARGGRIEAYTFGEAQSSRDWP